MIRFGEEDRPQGATETPQRSFNNVPAWQACAAIEDPARATPAIKFRNVKFSYVDRWTRRTRALTESGEAVFMKEEDRLCLINTKIMMLREGRVIFYGTDEEMYELEGPYIREFLLVE